LFEIWAIDTEKVRQPLLENPIWCSPLGAEQFLYMGVFGIDMIASLVGAFRNRVLSFGPPNLNAMFNEINM